MYKSSGTTVRQELNDIVLEYANDLNPQFMSLDILPIKNTDFKSGTFGKLPIENVTNESGTGLKAPGSGYSRQNSSYENDNFTCVKYGFEEEIDDDESLEAEAYFNMEISAAQLNFFRLKRAAEIRNAALLFNTSNFSGHTGNVTTEWSSTSGVPISDVQGKILTLKQAVGGALGDVEICMACSEKVFRNVIKTTEVKAAIMGGSGSMADKVLNADNIGAARLADILGINQVFYSAAQNGGSDVWDDEYALLFIRSTSDILRSSVQLGRTFLWTKSTPNYSTTETYRSEQVEANIVRVKHSVDEKIFNFAAGYLFQNITA